MIQSFQRGIVVVIGILFFLHPVLYAEQLAGFHVFEIDAKGAIQHIFPGDFNGDTLTDVCLVSNGSDSREPVRQLMLFYQNNNGMHETPDACLNLPEKAIGIDSEDINQDGSEDLVLLMRDGVYVWNPAFCDSSQVSLLFSEQHSLYAAHPTTLFHIPFILKNRNNMQLLWSTVENNRLYYPCERGFVLSETLVRMPDQRFERHTVVYPVPHLLFSNNPNQTNPDIWQCSNDKIAMFTSEQQTPTCVWKVPTSFEDRTIQSLQTSKMDLDVIDLNADRQLDVVATQAVRGGVTSCISHMQFYYNESGRLAGLPDQVVLTDNVHGEHRFCFLNDDLYPDLLVFRLDVTVFQAIRFLLTGKVTAGFDVYMNRSGMFASNPDQAIRWHLPVSLDQMILTPYESYSVEGDINGDGHLDLFARIDNEIYMMIPGSSRGIFDTDRKQYYHVSGSNQFVLEDFNGDRADDILFYTPNDPSNNKLIFYLSQ